MVEKERPASTITCFGDKLLFWRQNSVSDNEETNRDIF
jgi:hypothetical protein